MSTPVCRITNGSGKITEYQDLADAWTAIHRAIRKQPAYFAGVVGSRRRNSDKDMETCFTTLDEIARECLDAQTRLVVVSGLCREGGDHFAHLWALENRYALIEFPAQWDLYGKRAGFERNAHIALLAHELVAIVAPDRQGGTEDTVRHFNAKNPNVIARLV